eukprot:752723-Hanusia_phi.AAC.2
MFKTESRRLPCERFHTVVVTNEEVNVSKTTAALIVNPNTTVSELHSPQDSKREIIPDEADDM